jgi:pimeloyl-ACP methyl ester carboxylesterase
VPLPNDEAGDGPALILLHAGIADRTMWAEHLEPLAAPGRHVVAPDLPGFGEAPVAARDAPWDDVLDTLDALGIERATFVGNSFGGAVALRVAAIAPERVAMLVLVSAPPPDLDPSPRLRAAWEAEEEALERGDVDAALAAVVDAWTLPDAPQALRERVAAMQRRAFELQLAAPEPADCPDPLDETRTLDVPALVAAGEHDMPDFQGPMAALPHARQVVIEGAGHLAPLETPEAFRALLLDLLAA